jgi:sec-independent protein translocase protein TatA
LIVALLLFGAKRLPEVGSSIGKGIREFKRSLSDTQDAILSDPNERPAAPRQVDAAQQGAPTSGEPKRLSE